MDLRTLIEEGARKRGISERELGRQAGLGVGTLTRWKKGTREPRLSELRKLAEVLGMPALELAALALNSPPLADKSRKLPH